MSPVTKALATVTIRRSQKEAAYVRLTDSIFNGLEAVGGFMESLMHIGIMAVFFFQVRLFRSSFLRQLY